MSTNTKSSSNKNKKTINDTSFDSPLYRTIIKAIEDKKGENIVALDLRNIEEAVASFFIICDVQSKIQASAIVHNIIQEVLDNVDEKPYRSEEGTAWTLVDYVNIVVHVFQTEERKFYDLEGIWMDAIRTEYN